MLIEGNQINNFMSSSGSGTVINYGSGSGSDFLASYGYGSGSTSQKVTVPVPVPVPVPQHWLVMQDKWKKNGRQILPGPGHVFLRRPRSYLFKIFCV
jgi:hypothetical protein